MKHQTYASTANHASAIESMKIFAVAGTVQTPAPAPTHDLSCLDDHVLIAELNRRGNLVQCWSADDFDPVLDEDNDVHELEMSDVERDAVQKQAFDNASIDLDEIVISRGNEHLKDWWTINKESVLKQFKGKTA